MQKKNKGIAARIIALVCAVTMFATVILSIVLGMKGF